MLERKFTLGVDWEDFNQTRTMCYHDVMTFPSQGIERQTDTILELLNETNQKATFFVLGILAVHRPDLVKKIDKQGHEIALHGHAHTHLRKLNDKQIFDDIDKSKKIVTDIISKNVYGYRAPFFSVGKSNLNVLEILTELGLLYDSSIVPVKMRRYGFKDFETENNLYALPNGGQIVELPLSVYKLNNLKIPIAGGGYLRAIPKFFLEYAYTRLNQSGRDVNMYLHPYEMDTKRLDSRLPYQYLKDIEYSRFKNLKTNIRVNLFRRSCFGKIKSILQQYKFTTCYDKAIHIKERVSPTVLGCQK
jgi:polysaccharide deacetylase family protein (PEP-CTERM system associated)